jgi:hypothetical protein
MMKTLCVTLILSITITVSAQQVHDAKRDFVWLFGLTNDGILQRQTMLNFKTDSLKVSQISVNAHVLFQSNASICDTAGNLLFFTNGCVLQDSNLIYIEGADTINLGYDWERSCKSAPSIDITQGKWHVNGTWIVPVGNNKFKVLSVNQTDQYLNTSGMRYVNIRHTTETPKFLQGEDFERQFISGSLSTSKFALVRHGNGRDWWIVNEHRNTRSYFTTFFDSTNFQYPTNQTIVPELASVSPVILTPSGQACFSPNGKKYVVFDAFNSCKVFDFDRCSGKLSNFQQFIPFANGDSLESIAGCAISPNSRYLYLLMKNEIGQYDLESSVIASTGIKVAQYDGYLVPNPPPSVPFGPPHNFYQAQLGPDGKIYIFSTAGRETFTVIEHPDEPGINCHVNQHKFEFGHWGPVAQPPRFPNFRLGPVVGSPCDTITSAINEPEVMQARMQLRPNPATSYTVADLSVPDYSAEMQLTLTVSDLSGSEVGTYAVPPYAALQRIETGGLPNGVYFVALKSRGWVVRTEKLVVLRE